MNFVVLVALLLLAACQPLPHPFEHDTPPPNSPILTPPDSAGIVVAPVAGAPEPAAQALAAAMAKALQENDVPASTGASNRGSYRLSGSASTAPSTEGDLLVSIAWEMRDADGVTVSRQESHLSLPKAAWSQGGGDVAQQLVRQAAPSLAKMVQTTAPAPLAGTETLIAVRTVTGAPGDGGEALMRAMGDALRRANFTLTESTGPAPTFLVQGTVEMSPAANGKQQIRIAWALLRPDGGKIGQVQQENAIPAGSLDGNWGLTAYDVANAAAPGIAALIAESQRVGAKS